VFDAGNIIVVDSMQSRLANLVVDLRCFDQSKLAAGHKEAAPGSHAAKLSQVSISQTGALEIRRRKYDTCLTYSV